MPIPTPYPPREVKPSAVASVSFENGRPVITSPWVEMDGAGTDSFIDILTDFPPTFYPGFDGYEAASSTHFGQPGERYHPSAGMGNSRLWFGAAYNNPFFCNDLRVVRGQEGRNAKLVNISWAWNMASWAPSVQTCYVLVYTADGFGYSTGSLAFTNPYPAVIIRYDNLPKGIWYSNVDLSTTTLGVRLPNDGMGAYGCAFFTRVTPNYVVSNNAQPLLWGIKVGNPSYYLDRLQWDDDNPTNGVLESYRELYSYTNQANLEQIGGVLGLYTTSSPSSWLDWPVHRGKTWRVSWAYLAYWHTRPGSLWCPMAVDFKINGDNEEGAQTYRKDALAAASGRVTVSHYTGLVWGNRIEIDHGYGYRTTYSHLDQRTVSAGAQVTRGQRIGYIGSTGWAIVNNHLHFELWKNSSNVKPEPISGNIGFYTGFVFYRP
ncbi:MAG: M23 family metallopeptidase [Armatimonadota bacterium]|nr:M23 family metallopeptidase [Armatimonadota bacterium]